MMNDVSDNEVTIETAPSLGERLRLAREAKKLTINDITAELRLTRHTIEHIENERWSELHGRTYARGYFSNYVKFLGLPEDELLSAFNLEYAVTEPELLVAGKKDVAGNKKNVWLAFFLISIVSVLVWFAYQQWPKIESIDENIDTNLSALSPTISEKLVSSDGIYDEQGTAVIPTQQQEVNALEQPVNDEVQLQNDNKQLLGNEPADEILIKDEVLSNDVLVEIKPLIILNASLELVFNDESWVEVKDANSKVLLNKILKKGDVIILNAPAPLSVMLGRASAVKVKFNDEIFDASPYTVGNVARFILGAAS